VWTLPTDLLPEELTAFARELRNRVQAGDSKEALYIRASLVQVHDMGMAISPAHRVLVDRVHTFLREKNSN
jgi:hypothetical protein